MANNTYPAAWHTAYGAQTGESARQILPSILDLFRVSSLLEIGCGDAHWTQAAVNHNISDYVAVDGPWNNGANLLVDKARFVSHNLSIPLNMHRRFDLAVCLEVAEHVDAKAADVLIQSLTASSDVILFGAAIPFQGGFGHINEQWPSWWRSKFHDRGYLPYDLIRPLHWGNKSIHYWYRQNTFVYIRKENLDQSAAAAAAERTAYTRTMLFDAVHPEKYQEVASYQAIAMKRLLRRLPGWIKMRLLGKFGKP